MGLTSTGYTAPDTLTLVESMSDNALNSFGSLMDVSSNSAIGIFNGVTAIEIAQVFTDLTEFYTNINPNNAEGRMLENIALFGGIVRKGLVKSTGFVTFTGADGTTIPQATVLYVVGDESRTFLTDTEETIGSDGTVRVNVTAETTGATAAPAGTLTQLLDDITGVTSVTNTYAVSIGTDEVETEAALRARRNNTLSVGGNGTAAAIRAALEQVAGVTTVRIIMNNTYKWEEKGDTGNYRPPKSLEAIVENGSNDDIIQTIALTASGTSELFGDLTAFYIDVTGNTHQIRYSRPTEIPIYMSVTYTLYDEESFPEDGQSRIAQEIASWALSEYQLGVDVLVDRIYVPIFDVPGISGATILIGEDASTLLDADIDVQLFEKATVDAANIIVTEA